VHVHARAVVADQRLRHEGGGLAVACGDVVHGVLQDLHLVGLLDEAAGTDADFALAAGGDFVVVHLDDETELFAGAAHRVADVLIGIDRRHREVTALDAGTMTLVAFRILRVAVPGALHRVDFIRAAAQLVLPAHAVEDEEFVSGPNIAPSAMPVLLRYASARLPIERGSRS
jgi:hypothetical protein